MLNYPTLTPLTGHRASSLALVFVLAAALGLLTALPLMQPTASPADDARGPVRVVAPQTMQLDAETGAQLAGHGAASATRAADLLSAAESVALRDAYARHYDLGDGRFIAVASPTPINYLDSEGAWQPIQTAFAPSEAGYEVRENSLQSQLSRDNTSVSLISGDKLLFWQPQALTARGVDAVVLATPRTKSEIAPPELDANGTTLIYSGAWSVNGLTEAFQSLPGALKQSLVLAEPPESSGDARWLEYSAFVTVPPSTQLFVDGTARTGSVTTAGPVELRGSDGTLLLQFAPPLAYEQDRPEMQVAGRYQVMPRESGFELRVQTPYQWWTDPARTYPVVLDPTMQVIQDIEGATISTREVLSGVGVPFPVASVRQSTCVGHFVTDPPDFLRGYRRGYVRFPLPTLPRGAEPETATLVAVPESGATADDPTWSFYADRTTRQPTYVHEMTEDWSYLLSITETTPITYPAMNPSSNLAILLKVDPGKGLTDLPATTWDVTGIVRGWYDDPTTNLGLSLKLQFEDFYFFEVPVLPGHYPTGNCFPLYAQWSSLDDVVANPTDPTADGAGLGLLVEYIAPDLEANALDTIQVPSVNPAGSYLDQYHEYDFPLPGQSWQLIAAQGAFTNTGYANVPLDLVDGDGNLLMNSDAGTATSGNEAWTWAPNYVVVNGHQGPPADLAVRVQPDNQPTATHNGKTYYLQTQRAFPAPAPPPVGISTTVPVTLLRELVRGQLLAFTEDTTVEIQVPYASAGLTKSTAHRFDLQIFSPGTDYGSRTTNGAELTRGPDAYEIEFSVQPGQSGDWLLVLNSNQDREIVNMQAQITACQNDDETVRYPLNGECVELQRPPDPFPGVGPIYQELGSLRLLSPAGFTNDCSSVCQTIDEIGGVPVMPMIGFGDDDDHWVALKGGTFELDRNTNRIRTSADSRLVLADFSDPTLISSIPVLRGQFEALGPFGRLISPISAPNDTYLLVKSPLHSQDTVNGWQYEIELDTDFLRAFGPLVREVKPSVGGSTTDFSFDAEWRIAAQGGPTLQGDVDLTTVSNGVIDVGTLLLTPPGSGYDIEYDPRHVSAGNPAALPLFLQVRMTGATVAQPDNLGGAKLPVQGVLLPPGQSVKDEEGINVFLECGAHCLDLRGDPDAMTGGGPLVDREYRMPDLIIQDTANTIMFNTPEGVDIWSTDHPLAAPNASGMAFNYEAYDGSVRTFRMPCPGPHDPFNDNTQLPPGPVVTVVKGSAGMVLPNVGADSGDLSDGPRVQATFTLCEGSLRQLTFDFSTGTQTAIPLGNSGMYVNYIGGVISLTPQQPGSQAYTTVLLETRFRGMSPQQSSSNILSRGAVTIDSRGLFDVQVQTGVRVFANVGAGVDGHFWVAWSPLDLGFEVEGCIPYNGFNPESFASSLCDGNELLYGMLRMHLWQGQGWQNAYPWLPDDDALHVAARFEARLTLASGIIAKWGPVVLPPADITLAGLKLAFGEFCMNNSCTSYEWGVMGAFIVLGYDIGAYYGFESGLSFILGSADYVLIDEANLAMSSLPAESVSVDRSPSASANASIVVAPNLDSAMFILGWPEGSGNLTLTEPPPGNRTIDLSTVAPDVTVAITPTTVGDQTVISIEDPLPGTWEVDFGNPAGDYRFVFFANRPAPEIVLGTLPLESVDEATLPISWTSDLAEGWISLYYEQIAGGLDASQVAVGPIVERLPLEASGVYSWNLEGIATGSYRVFARIDTDIAMAVANCGPDYQYNPDPTAQGCNTMLDAGLFMPIDEVYAPGSVRIRDTVPPAPPSGVDSRPEGVSSVVVRWRPNAEKDLAGYLVTCQQGALTRVVRAVAQIQASQTLSDSARVNGLSAVPASCSVEAYDNSGNVGLASASTSSTPTGNIPLPPAQVQNVQLQPVGPGQIQISWQPSVLAAQYLLHYAPVFSDSGQAPLSPLMAMTGDSLVGGYRAAQGRSPINVGDVLQATLTDLPAGTTYEVWVRPMDEDGRVGPSSARVQVVVEGGSQLFLPILFQQ